MPAFLRVSQDFGQVHIEPSTQHGICANSVPVGAPTLRKNPHGTASRGDQRTLYAADIPLQSDRSSPRPVIPGLCNTVAGTGHPDPSAVGIPPVLHPTPSPCFGKPQPRSKRKRASPCVRSALGTGAPDPRTFRALSFKVVALLVMRRSICGSTPDANFSERIGENSSMRSAVGLPGRIIPPSFTGRPASIATASHSPVCSLKNRDVCEHARPPRPQRHGD